MQISLGVSLKLAELYQVQFTWKVLCGNKRKPSMRFLALQCKTTRIKDDYDFKRFVLMTFL